ncbi:MAG: YjbQ family protein, partial [Thermodesulfobacteriota bacterium]|nr:YjbQ family protein [Thermodesulfobacteriota bacterium]
MPVKNREIFVQTKGKTDIIDLTSKVARELEESSVENGTVALFVPGSTAAVTTIEFESGVINDLKKAIQRMA